LSGNKFSVLLLVVLLLSACKTKKKVVDNRPNRPTTTRPTSNSSNAKSKVDTISWSEGKVNRNATRSSDSEYSSGGWETSPLIEGEDKRDRYTVVGFIPFDSDQYSPGSLLQPGSNEHRFVNYYAGIKMGLEDLEQDGAKLDFVVKDSESGNFVNKLKECKGADVIIGPYKKEYLVETAHFCKQNQIVNVSPWRASSKITSENPYYIQLRPNITEYYHAIVAHAMTRYNQDKIYVIGRNDGKDRGMMDYVHQCASLSKGLPETTKVLQEYLINVDSLHNEASTYDGIFHQGVETAFIIPHYLSKDEFFVYDAIRKLAGERGSNRVGVYCMPMVYDSEKIGAEYYGNLNMKIARAKWVDRTDMDVRNFRNRYFLKFNALPSDDAIDGYDMITFIGKNLMNHGKTFQFTLDQDSDRYLQSAYDVQKIYSTDKNSLDKFTNINYFENKSLDIIEFRNGKFSRVNY